MRRFRRIPIAACLLLTLVPASGRSQQKAGGLAFWEPPAPAASLLERSPHNDPGRYAALRQTFIDFHCTDALMQEQAAGPRGDKNLVCTLPGQTQQSILVITRYDGKADAGFQPTWVDAYLLPILYHALQAQPRRHTFIFATLHGEDGEAAFFSQLHASPAQPSAMIVLDGLGFGPPLWYTVAPPKQSADPANPWGVNGTLGGVAAAVGRALKVPPTENVNPDRYLTHEGYALAQAWRGRRQKSTLFVSAGDLPELLIYADRPINDDQVNDVSTADIHKDLDYIAWFLCFTDIKLDPPSAATGSPANRSASAAPAQAAPAPAPTAATAPPAATPASPQ